jgi:hypothetical protein
MIIPQKLGLWQKVLALGAAIGSALTGCVTGGSVEPFINFNARAIKTEMPGMEYNPSLSFGVKGRAKTKSKVEVEAEVSLYSTNGESGIVNHDVEATEVSVNVLYPVWSNGKGDIYVGAGATSTSQTVDETYDPVPGITISGNYSETDARVFVGGRIRAGKGNINARLTIGARSTTVDAGYEFNF